MNFVHTDVKPEMILIGREETDVIHLFDFGLASKYRDDSG